MELDIFFSISQTEVDGYMPSERVDVRELLRAGRARGPARVRDGVGGGEPSLDRGSEDESGGGDPALCRRDRAEHRHPAARASHLRADEADRRRVGHHEHPLQRRADRGGGARQDVSGAARTRSERAAAADGRLRGGTLSVHQHPVRNRAAECGRGSGVAGGEEQDLRGGDGDFSAPAEGRNAQFVDDRARGRCERKDFRSDADWQRVIEAYGHEPTRFRSRRAGCFRT